MTPQEPDPWTLARIAYEAYMAAAIARDSLAAPAWDSLTEAEQARWEGVATTIANTITGPGYGGGRR